MLAGCHPLGSVPEPGDDDPAVERVVVTPAALDFGLVSVNHLGEQHATLTLHNLGNVPVTVTGHDTPRGDEAWTIDAPPLLGLDPGDQVDLDLAFHPSTDAEYAAELVVEPGSELVRLEGRGSAPVVEVGETLADPVVLGCAGAGEVGVSNPGSEALLFESVSSSSTEFAVVGWPDRVPPEGEDRVRFTFTPGGGGARGTVLTLQTNDPARPAVAVSVSVLGYEGERVEERFTYTPSNPTDILFLVDGGATMEELLTRAPPGIDAFVDKLRDSNIDYQVTGVSSGGPCPEDEPAYASRYDTSLRTEALLERAFGGAGGAWDDDLLGLAAGSLDETRHGGCLEGFRRPGADLHLICVTDGPASVDVGDRILDLAADWGTLRLSALTPADDDCGDPDDAWEDAVTTTDGVLADLCAESWIDAFTDFATLPPGSEAVSYPLAEPPVASTLVVTVEEREFEQWSYDEVANAVVFDGDSVPALGAEVAITYVLAVACEG